MLSAMSCAYSAPPRGSLSMPGHEYYGCGLLRSKLCTAVYTSECHVIFSVSIRYSMFRNSFPVLSLVCPF